jgi:hypothetical protein
MRPHNLTKIRYAKTITEDDSQFIAEKTERTIVPTVVPGNIKAIDVTDLADDEQQKMCELYEEYAQYFDNHQRTAYSFEDWASLSKNVDVTPKWRTFKPNQTEEIA